MGVLYFGSDISRPSVLWMRRMLDGLDGHVATLATEVEPPLEYRQRYKSIVVKDSSTVMLWKVVSRLGIIQQVPKTKRAIRTLSEGVGDPDVDVTLIHYLTTAVRYARVWENTSKPVFVHCHGYDVTWDLRAVGRPDRRAHPTDYADRIRALPPHVKFVANSNQTRTRLLDTGIEPERIHLKYLGVPVESEPPSRDYSKREVAVLFLGRLVDFKGPLEVIRAFSIACDRGLQGKLVMAGDGPLMNECRLAQKASKHASRIEVLGAVDVETGMRLRAQADIFTAHNRLGPDSRQEEAFGVSVVEALAAGLPVITGNSGSLSEVMVDGEHGRLVEPGDIEAHAEAFIELATNPEVRARMGHSGWQRVRANFSLEREGLRLREILGIAQFR